jgi:uncharacterized protein YecE (DUF72 family)
VRLHGRNYEQWFSSAEHPEERYNYLYSMNELEPWAERINHIAQRAEVTFVITNNHFQGPINIPENMLEHYPELMKIALPGTSVEAPRQTDLGF